MYLPVVLFMVSLTVSAGEMGDFEHCLTVLNSEKHCCNKPARNKTMIDGDIKECTVMPNIPGSCEKALCFGSKLGISTDEGVIMEEKLQKHLEEKLSDHKDIFEAINKECFDEKYKSFGEADECDLNKMGNCLKWQYIFSDWACNAALKDSAKHDMLTILIDPNTWDKVTKDRDAWRKTLSNGRCPDFSNEARCKEFKDIAAKCLDL